VIDNGSAIDSTFTTDLREPKIRKKVIIVDQSATTFSSLCFHAIKVELAMKARIIEIN
jgi:hypothetical protein